MKKTEHGYREEDRGYLTPCWIWTGHINKTCGYGYFRKRMAHRVYYMKHVGEIPPGTELDHLCRVRACVNPGHLEPVSRRINVLRGAMCKLSDADANAIRCSTGPAAPIAAQYGITRQYVYQLRSGSSKRALA